MKSAADLRLILLFLRTCLHRQRLDCDCQRREEFSHAQGGAELILTRNAEKSKPSALSEADSADMTEIQSSATLHVTQEQGLQDLQLGCGSETARSC